MSALGPGIARAVVTALILGVVSSFGDWLWASFIPDGAVVPGIVHGVLIFLILALVLGRASGVAGATRSLLKTLPIGGLLIAAAFYPIAMVVGYLGGLLITWIAMWLTLATLLRRARGGRESRGRALTRGAIAAGLSGLAFWAISGIWTNPSAEPVNYLLRAAYWAFAFFPGFAALLVGQPDD
ncbi:MAG: hypothetical protein AAF604_03195 [Acidobacteriota bacterium]